MSSDELSQAQGSSFHIVLLISKETTVCESPIPAPTIISTPTQPQITLGGITKAGVKSWGTEQGK